MPENYMTRKHNIAARLVELNEQARVLRDSGQPVGEGIVTPHVAAVADNHVQTITLKRELAGILRRQKTA
jgi:hypothetical protein